ncbi:MAG TPA: envelope stress response membrane protein PspB [Allosphingosinicella sp.]|jgi:phage shock protein B
MEEVIIPVLAILTAIIGLPWLVFHYITRWKTAATLTSDDERLMEELYDLARRLDDRMCSIERIMTAENPNWRAIACDPAATGIEDRTAAAPIRRIGQ